MKALFALLLLVSSSAFSGDFDWDANKSVHENILAMDNELQMFTLAFLVRETGRSCKPVLHAYQGGTKSGDHYWMIGCANGMDWSVTLAKEGYQVVNCIEWEKFSLRPCLASF